MSDQVQTPQQKYFPVEIFPHPARLKFLTDRWGEVIAWHETDAMAWSNMDLSIDQVEDAVKQVIGIFPHETSFLIHDSTDDAIKIYIEFEFSEEWQPQALLDLETTPDEIEQWRKALLFHGVALLHVAKGIARMPEPWASQMRCVFDVAAPYNGAIGLIMPLEAIEMFETAQDLLFKNDLPFPHSAHAQMAAASEIYWHYDGLHIPKSALPGMHLPLLRL